MTAWPFVKLLCMALLWATSANVSLGGSLARQVSTLPDVSAPAGGTAVWIAKAMRLNGVPMTLKAFRSSMRADDVLHDYERQLRGDAQTRRGSEGAERVLAILGRDHYITIRARNTVSGSEGTIAVSPVLASFEPDKRTLFPLPRTSRVVSLQVYEDEGIEAEHISAISKRTPAIEARAFAVALEQRGWQVLRREPGVARASDQVIEAQKAASLTQITLQRDRHSGDTTITIVWRKT